MAEDARVTLSGPAPVDALWQVALWPDRLAEGLDAVAAAAGVPAAPGPGASVAVEGRRLLRTGPATIWALGGAAPALDPALGTVLELGPGRSVVRVAGPAAAALLARFTAVDLRDRAFPDGAVAATGLLHAPGVILRRDADGAPGHDLFVMRSWGEDLVAALARHAAQFGCARV